MKQDLLSVQQPDGDPPPPEVMGPMMRDLEELNNDIRASGGWVFAGGLHPVGSATVVRSRNGEVVLTDGPYTEGTEHVGGLTIVEAPDLDTALGWAGRMAAVTTLPIEVRPFQGGDHP